VFFCRHRLDPRGQVRPLSHDVAATAGARAADQGGIDWTSRFPLIQKAALELFEAACKMGLEGIDRGATASPRQRHRVVERHALTSTSHHVNTSCLSPSHWANQHRGSVQGTDPTSQGQHHAPHLIDHIDGITTTATGSGAHRRQNWDNY
jgi:hypothetical protein